jgi:predicted nucleotidyltransferase
MPTKHLRGTSLPLASAHLLRSIGTIVRIENQLQDNLRIRVELVSHREVAIHAERTLVCTS